jgi:hypothetical protein
MPKSKFKKCRTCGCKITLKDNYRKGSCCYDDFVKPCDECEHAKEVNFDDYESPCFTCIHSQDG